MLSSGKYGEILRITRLIPTPTEEIGNLQGANENSPRKREIKLRKNEIKLRKNEMKVRKNF